MSLRSDERAIAKSKRRRIETGVREEMADLIGFIGLGNMGRAMAGALLTAGYWLHVYNRTPEKARSLIAAGAHWATLRRPAGLC